MLRESRNIAFKVLERLDELGWKQNQLATAMDVSPQYINKLVKGKENFTLETLVKLQQTLDIPILASYLEKQEESSVEFKGEGTMTVNKIYFSVRCIADSIPLGTDTTVVEGRVKSCNNYLPAC